MDEIDDAPVFGKQGPQPVEEGYRGGMDGIEPEESRFLNGKRRKGAPEALKELSDLFLSTGLMPDQTMGNEFLNMRSAQRHPDRIAVFDLVEGVLIDLSRLVDPLLKACNDPEGERGGLFS
jgi:hypothetical protein